MRQDPNTRSDRALRRQWRVLCTVAGLVASVPWLAAAAAGLCEPTAAVALAAATAALLALALRRFRLVLRAEVHRPLARLTGSLQRFCHDLRIERFEPTGIEAVRAVLRLCFDAGEVIHRRVLELDEQLRLVRFDERRLRSALDAHREGMLICSRDGRIVTNNQRARRILAGGKDLTGRYLRDLVGDALGTVIEQDLRQIAGAPERFRRHPAMQFRQRLFDVTLQAIDGDDLHEVLLTFVDVTELCELNTLKDELLIAVSQELTAPLGELVTDHDLLALGTGSGVEWKDIAGKLRTETRRLKHAVDEVLHFSRIQGNAVTFEPRHEDVSALVRAVVKLRDVTAAQRRIKLRTELDADARAMVDASYLTQALLRLLDEVMRHCDDGGSVLLAVHSRPDGVHLTLDGDGHAMAAADRSRLFMPRVANGGATHGLSMPICQRIIERSGGMLVVEDSPRGGIRFRTQLPAIPLAQSERR